MRFTPIELSDSLSQQIEDLYPLAVNDLSLTKVTNLIMKITENARARRGLTRDEDWALRELYNLHYELLSTLQ